MQDAVDAVTTTYATLSVSQKAWFIAMMGVGDDLDPLWEHAGTSGEDPLLSLAALWRYMDPGHGQEALDDPVFVAGLESDLPLVVGLAKWIRDRINDRAQGELAPAAGAP